MEFDREKLLKLAETTNVAAALKVMQKLGSFNAKESLERNMLLSKLAEEISAGNIPPEILALLAEEEEEDTGANAALSEIQDAVLEQADETPSLVPDDVALDIVSGAAGSAGEESNEADVAEILAELMGGEEEEEEEESVLNEEDLKTAAILFNLGILK